MLISRILIKATLAFGTLGLEVSTPAEGITVATTGNNQGVVDKTEPGISNVANVLSRDDLPPHDCDDILRRDITPEIDCSYSWENCGFDNHLEYHIRINAIGKTSPKWCDMMFHEVQRSINYHIRLESCDRTYKSNENGNGMEIVLTLPKPIPKFGEWRLNVEQVIKDNMCKGGPELNFWVNERCYRSSICRHRWWKRSLESELPGSLPAFASPPEEVESAFLSYAAPITATTFSTEPTMTKVVPQAETAPTTANHAAATNDYGTDNNPKDGLRPADRCPSPPEEDRTCDNVDRSLINSVGVHCSFVTGQGKDADMLDYKIAIDPTGQNTRCWCGQLLAAIHDRCTKGQVDWAYPLSKCNNKHTRNELGYGISINFYNNAWVVGDDNRGCIKAAIESTTCGIPTHFDRGGCFKSD
ncbi:hypothetical protein CSPAE12_11306 [Colletotrichum incanum]|nr:hypothetical protein CSPAE12_11306 [Colletotrichum incanum]